MCCSISPVRRSSGSGRKAAAARSVVGRTKGIAVYLLMATIRLILFPSFPRKREGGVTFEVQRVQEDLGRGSEVQAFPRGVVVEAGELLDLHGRQHGEIGFSRQTATKSAD